MYEFKNIPITRPIDKINWRTAYVNVIYIPFTGASLDKYMNDIPNSKLVYKHIIVPDMVHIAGSTVRTPSYTTKMKKILQTPKFYKYYKKSIATPAIVDMSPVFETVLKRAKGSGGYIRLLNEFFKYVADTRASIQNGYPTIVIYDNTSLANHDLKMLLTYFKYHQYKLPFEITDKYGLVYNGVNYGYYVLHTQDTVLRNNATRLLKFVEKAYSQIDKKDVESLLDTDKPEPDSLVKVMIDAKTIGEALAKKVGQKFDSNTIDTIKTVVNNFIEKHPEINIKAGDTNSVSKVIELALEYSNKTFGSSLPKKASFKDMVASAVKNLTYKMNVVSDMMKNKIKPLGLNMHKITKLDFVVDPGRTATEFNENMDKNIMRIIDAINDEKLRIRVEDVRKKVVDNFSNRVNIYEIKIRPLPKGRAYWTKLVIPALIHKGNYFKINGQLYVINNQLMQDVIIKKAENQVQLKTNYSVITYSIRRTSLEENSFTRLVDKFIRHLKVAKTLKKAQVISKNTESLLIDYGVPATVVDDLTYEYVELKKPPVVIDFTKEVTINGSNVIRFYTRDENEYAYMDKTSSDIVYVRHGDIHNIPKSRLKEFILDRYEDINRELFGQSLLAKSERSVPYFEVFLVRHKIPAVYYLGFTKGLKWAFEQYGVDYHFNRSSDPGAYFNVPIYIDGEKKVLSLYPKSTRGELLVNGLRIWKLAGAKFHKDLNDRQPIEEIIVSKLSERAIRDLKLFEDKIIDPVTEDMLKSEGLPTQFSELLATTMTDRLLNSEVQNPVDMRNARIRLGEAILDIIYANLMISARAVAEGTKDKLSIDPNYIINELQKSGLVHYTKSLSPLDELAQTRKVTKTGFGNPMADNITLNQRDITDSAYGVLTPTSTHEYSKIGVTHAMTASTQFRDRYGRVESKKFDAHKEAHDVAGLNELFTSPFLHMNDQTRNVMGAQQSAQYLELNNPDIPLVQTGYETLAPHVVSDRFSKRAECDGKVVDITSEYIKIKCKEDNKEHLVDIRAVRSRTKRGVYLNKKYKVIVSKGQSVKKGDILALSPSLQHGMITPGKNVVIAIMPYKGYNFEDGFVVSPKLLGKYAVTEVEKITVNIEPGEKVLSLLDKIGVETKQGDPLIVYKYGKDDTHLEDFMDQESSANELEDDVFKGIKDIKDGKVTYASPGGTVVDIVIKINNEKGLDPKVKALYKRLVQTLHENEKLCSKYYDKNTDAFVECAYSHENNIMLKKGEHKINGVEFEGAVIEFYIEKNTVATQSSKIVLGATGAKGTIQYIMDKDEIPVAVESGLEIDLIVSPLSIFARKSLAVMANLYLGKIVYFVNLKAQQLAKKGNEKSIYKLIKKFYSLIDKTDDGRIVEAFEAEWDPKTAIKQLKARDPLTQPYYPAIGLPFVNKLSLNEIVDIGKALGIPLHEKVRIKGMGETSVEVPVGIIHAIMTEHLAHSMTNAISMTTKRSGLTGQGRSGSKMGHGGQAAGQYDISSILSGAGVEAKDVIKEISKVRSDDPVAEQAYMRTLIKTGKPVSLKELPTDEGRSKKMVDMYLIAAGIQP